MEEENEYFAEDEQIDGEQDYSNEKDDYYDEIDDDWITLEEAKKNKEDLKKASRKIVELKKQLKEKKVDTSTEFVTKEDLAIDKFLVKNPELEEYKNELIEYTKKGLSLDKAKLLVENDDKTIKNRQKINSMSVSDWDAPWSKSFTQSDLENMSQIEYEKAVSLIKSWKAKRV